MSHRITDTQIKVVDLLFPVVGLLFTAARLFLRIRLRRLWWDDALALASAIFTALMSVATWIHYMDPVHFSRTTRIAAYYGVAQCFNTSLWLARLSILFSILRIIPNTGTKRILQGASISFALIWLFLFSQVLWVCVNQPHWKDMPQPQCALGLQVAICQLLTDIAADCFLIVIPTRLFLRSSLDKGTKFRLIVIFSAAALTTIVSLVHAAYILRDFGPQAIIAGIVEISISLIVCNFVVVLPAVWRSCGMHVESSGEGAFGFSTVRFAPSQGRTHISRVVGDLDSTRDPAVLDVAGIVHNGPSTSSIELSGTKGGSFYHSEEQAIDTTQKARQISQDQRNDILHEDTNQAP